MICQEERPQRNEWMECCWKLKPDPLLFPNLHTRVACTLDCQTKANQHDELMLSCQLQSRQTIYTKIFAYFFFINLLSWIYGQLACLEHLLPHSVLVPENVISGTALHFIYL